MPDDDDDAAFTEKVNKILHKALTDRDGRLEKKLLKNFDTMLGGKFDELRTQLTADIPDDDDVDVPDVVPAVAPGGTPTPGVAQLSPEDRARIKRAEQQAKEANDKAEKFRIQAEKAEAEKAHTEERQMLQSTLAPYVKPKLLDIVVDQIHGKHLHRDPDSKQMFWKDENGETLPLKDGAAAWSKSDVGKEFAPPVESRGRGGRGPNGSGDGVTPGKMTSDTLGDIVMGSIPGQRH